LRLLLPKLQRASAAHRPIDLKSSLHRPKLLTIRRDAKNLERPIQHPTRGRRQEQVDAATDGG
jgi:hypothetical protein